MPSDARAPLVVGFVGQRLARGRCVLAILFEPGAELRAKRLIFGTIVEVHLPSCVPPYARFRQPLKMHITSGFQSLAAARRNRSTGEEVRSPAAQIREHVAAN